MRTDTSDTYRYVRIYTYGMIHAIHIGTDGYIQICSYMQIQTIHTMHAYTRLGRVRFQNTYTYRYILIHANAYKYTDTYIYKWIHTDIEPKVE